MCSVFARMYVCVPCVHAWHLQKPDKGVGSLGIRMYDCPDFLSRCVLQTGEKVMAEAQVQGLLW